MIFPGKGEGPRRLHVEQVRAPEGAAGSPSQTRTCLGALAKLCSPGDLYSHWAQALLSAHAPPPPKSPSLHTEVLGCEWTVNHHFGILHCFWVNCLCAPFLPFRQKDSCEVDGEGVGVGRVGDSGFVALITRGLGMWRKY